MRTIKIFNRDSSHQNKKHKFVAHNSSIIHNITSIAQCKSQQNVLTTGFKIKISNKKYLRNKSVLKTVNTHNDTLHISQTTTHNKLWRHYFMCVLLCDGYSRHN